MTALAAAALLYLIGLAFLLWEVLTAPEGWEDEHGFHYGKPPNEYACQICGRRIRLGETHMFCEGYPK